MNHPSPLIHRPDRQAKLVRRLWQAVTAVCWAAYLYLWLPLFTLLLWMLGLEVAVFELYERRDQVDPFVALILPLLALVSAVLLISWAEYNRIRFQGKERRQAFDNVGRNEIAIALGARSEVAEAMGRHKIQVLKMDDQAHPQATRALPGKPTVRPPTLAAKPTVPVHVHQQGSP